MKTINVPLEDNEHNLLLKAKGGKSWHDFVMELTKLGDVRLLMTNFPQPDGAVVSEDYATELSRWYESVSEVLTGD